MIKTLPDGNYQVVCPHHQDNELLSNGACDLCIEEEYNNPFHDYGECD